MVGIDFKAIRRHANRVDGFRKQLAKVASRPDCRNADTPCSESNEDGEGCFCCAAHRVLDFSEPVLSYEDFSRTLAHFRIKHPGAEIYQEYAENAFLKMREAEECHALRKQEEAMSALDSLQPAPDNATERQRLLQEIEFWGNQSDSIRSEAKTQASALLP